GREVVLDVDLRRTGLATDAYLALREAEERATRGAAVLRRDAVHRGADVVELVLRQRQAPTHRRVDRLHDLATRRHDRLPDPWLEDGPAVGQCGVGDRELQRGDEHGALADVLVLLVARLEQIPVLAVLLV